MALIIGGGISIGGQITISPTGSTPLTSGMLFEYNAGNSMSYSGSGASFSDAGFINGPSNYDINYLFDLNSDYTNATLGNYGVLLTEGGVTGPVWVSQGNQSYFTFDGGVNAQFIDSNSLNGNVLSAGSSYTYFTMVNVNNFGTPDNPGTWTGGIVAGAQSIFGFVPNGASPSSYPALVAGNQGIGSFDAYDLDTQFQPNTWYAVAVTYDADSQVMKLYVDGVNTQTFTGVAPFSNSEPLYWGTWEGANWMNGKMGVMSAWDRALSSSEITTYTNNVAPAYQSTPLQTYSQLFTTVGENSFVVPAGVTSISMVAVGAGGGGTQDAYSNPGQLSGVFNNSVQVTAQPNQTGGNTNQLYIDSNTYPSILTVTTDYMVSSSALNDYYPQLNGAALASITSIDSTDPNNVIVNLNKNLDYTTSDSFTFTLTLVAADGGPYIDASQYSNGNDGPGLRALPLVYNAGGGRGGVVDYLDSWGLGGGGAGGYGIKNNPFVAFDPNQTYLYNNNNGDTGTGVANVVIELSNTDLTATAIGNSIQYTATGTYPILPTDKVMFSITQDVYAGADNNGIGLGNYSANIADFVGGDTNSIGYWNDGTIWYNNSIITPGLPTSPNNGDIIDLAVDRINSNMWIRINGGDWNGNVSADPATNLGGQEIMQGNAGDPNLYLMVGLGFDTNHGAMSINTSNAYPIPSGFTFIAGDAAGGSTGGDGSYYGWFTAKPGQQADGGGSGAGGGGRYEDSGTGGGGVGLYGAGNPGTLGVWASQDDLNANYIGAIATGGRGGSRQGNSGTQGGQATAWNGGYGGWPGGGGGSATGYYDSGNGGALAFSNNITVTPGQTLAVFVGAGGLGVDDGGNGSNGAVRIVWPGDTRTFPYTNAGVDPAGPTSLTIGTTDFTSGYNDGVTPDIVGGYVVSLTATSGNIGDQYAQLTGGTNAIYQNLFAFFRQLGLYNVNSLNYTGSQFDPNNFNAYIFNVTWADSSTGKVRMGYNASSGVLFITTVDTGSTDWQTASPSTYPGPTNPVQAGTFSFPATFTLYTPTTESSGNYWC